MFTTTIPALVAFATVCVLNTSLKTETVTENRIIAKSISIPGNANSNMARLAPADRGAVLTASAWEWVHSNRRFRISPIERWRREPVAERA